MRSPSKPGRALSRGAEMRALTIHVATASRARARRRLFNSLRGLLLHRPSPAHLDMYMRYTTGTTTSIVPMRYAEYMPTSQARMVG